MQLFLSLCIILSNQLISCGSDLLSPDQLKTIGYKIWHNETSKSKDKLTWWLQGEDWASLGIGHFIWYPKGVKIDRTQTFPELMRFLQSQGKKLPSWMHDTQYCPWKSKDDFFLHFNDAHMIELRELLFSTIDLQTKFIIQRFNNTLKNLMSAAKKNKRKHITQQFKRMEHSAQGLYALIDYVNFKGEGTNPLERYNNQGWGLLQILDLMRGIKKEDAIDEFVTVAQDLLLQRVNNSPQKNEERYLPGWKNRVNTYLQPL